MSEPRHVTQARAERAREKEAARLEQFEDSLYGTAAALHVAALAGMKEIGGVTLTDEESKGLAYGLQELLADAYHDHRPDPDRAYEDTLNDFDDLRD